MRAAVLTVSDGVAEGTREDESGDLLGGLLAAEGYEVERRIVPDDRDAIAEAIAELAEEAAVVLTTGGTGLAARDITPEATAEVLERSVPGIAEAIRADSIAKTPHALLSRGIAGVRGETLVVNLPGSPGGCRDGFEVLRPALAHAVSLLAGKPTAHKPNMTAIAYPRRFYSLVKFEHTIFALPFAYVGAFLAVDGAPSAHDLLWITVAMVGARSLAMGLNRLIDAGLDARNPRTARRELPAGLLSKAQVVLFCAGSLALFLVAVYQLDPLVHWLWPIPVVGFVVYPYLKRWTWLCHLWLGAVDGLAPIGAWAAIKGELPWEAWALGGAVALWVAGFDFFYSLLDLDIDREQGLQSVAVRFGERGVFWGARLFHLGTVVLLAAVGVGLDVGVLYWLGVAVVAGLLAYEHSIVRPGDLRRLDTAFFTMNGVISVAFFAFVLADSLA